MKKILVLLAFIGCFSHSQGQTAADVLDSIHTEITTQTSYHGASHDIVGGLMERILYFGINQNLQNVTDNGNTTINPMITGSLTSGFGGLFQNDNIGLYKNGHELVRFQIHTTGPNSIGQAVFQDKFGNEATIETTTLTGFPTYVLPDKGSATDTFAMKSDFSAVSPMVYNLGAISIPVATSSVNGYLSSANWTFFNSKMNGLTPTAVKTANYSVAVGDLVPCNTTSAGFNVTLPSAAADGSIIGIKLVIQSSTNTVTITASGGDVFNKAGGGTTLTLSLLNQGYQLQYKASTGIWYAISGDLPLSSTFGAVSGDVTINSSGVATIKTSVGLTGAPTATTQPAGTNSNAIATTAYVDQIGTQYTTSATFTTSVTPTSTVADARSMVKLTITAQAGSLLFNTPTGSWADGQTLLIDLKDNGTSRALTYSAAYVAGTTTNSGILPSATVISTRTLMQFMYCSNCSTNHFLFTGYASY